MRTTRHTQRHYMSRTSVLLNNDQILALPTTPIEVVPAPGVGKYLVPHLAIIESDFSAGNYDNISDATLALGASDIVITVGENIVNVFRAVSMGALGPVESRRVVSVLAPVQPTYPRSQETDDTWGNSYGYLANGFDHVENMHWTIAADNADGDFTEGHEDNWLLVKLFYTVEMWHTL